MHVGIFVEERRRDTSEAVAFRDAVELAEAAERQGLDGVWLGEIHFTPIRSVQSAPMALASYLAARTERVRIGTAVTVLPLVHPLRIAEEAATVDQLSQGRFDLGIGRSGAASTYDALGIPYGESQARFEEALAILREAWKGEPFSTRGVPTGSGTPWSRRVPTRCRTRRSGWPPTRRRPFPGSAGPDCRCSQACATSASRSSASTSPRTARRGASPGTPGRANVCLASRSTPRRRRRRPARSRART